MNCIDTSVLTDRIAAFVKEQDALSPSQAERALIEILGPLFEADGYTLDHTGTDRDSGVDYRARREVPGSAGALTTVVEYKHFRGRDRLVPAESVRNLLGAAILQQCERAILLTNSRFSKAAEETLLRELPLEFQLMNIDSLRAWVQRIERAQEKDVSPVLKAVEALSRELARLIARNPRFLDEIEWRDLERVLAEVFDGLGFKVELTPPSKDGGKDLVLTCEISGNKSKYLVEVKHWQWPGSWGKAIEEICSSCRQ